ncbi:MAG TPA: hypothetical protein VMM15_40015 [Bradyrhizobium sp.]|nr:hypothetical protein [Bradyrhizobium sp.]
MSRSSRAMPVCLGLGILAFLVPGTLGSAKEQQLSGATETEEANISRTVGWGLAERNELYFVFDRPTTNCTESQGEPLTAAEISFLKHGIAAGDISFTKHGVWFFPGSSGNAEFFSLQSEYGSRVTGLIKAEQSMFEIAVQKYVRNKTSDWTVAAVSSFENIKDLDQRESKYVSTHVSSERNLAFLFDTADEDDCAQGIGFFMSENSALRTDMPGRFKDKMFPAKSRPFERKFRIEQGRCKYEMTVKLYFKSGGVFTPLHARYLGGDDFDR